MIRRRRGGLGLFLFIEWRIAAEPFAPGHIILERTLFACYLCNFFSFAGYMGTLFYLPLYFQAVQGYTALKAGLLLLPSVVAGVSGSLFAGKWMQYFGRYYWLTVIAYANLVLGLVIITLFSGVVRNSDVGMCVGMVFCGFSNGIGVTSSLIALSMSAVHNGVARITNNDSIKRGTQRPSRRHSMQLPLPIPWLNSWRLTLFQRC